MTVGSAAHDNHTIELNWLKVGLGPGKEYHAEVLAESCPTDELRSCACEEMQRGLPDQTSRCCRESKATPCCHGCGSTAGGQACHRAFFEGICLVVIGCRHLKRTLDVRYRTILHLLVACFPHPLTHSNTSVGKPRKGAQQGLTSHLRN